MKAITCDLRIDFDPGALPGSFLVSSRRRRRHLRLHLLRPRPTVPHPDYLVVCFFLDLLVFSLHFLKSNRMDELGRGS